MLTAEQVVARLDGFDYDKLTVLVNQAVAATFPVDETPKNVARERLALHVLATLTAKLAVAADLNLVGISVEGLIAGTTRSNSVLTREGLRRRHGSGTHRRKACRGFYEGLAG